MVKRRFFSLAVGRALQFSRSADIMTVRRFIGGNSNCNAVLGGQFTTYKKAGAVTGEDSGDIDSRGFPYKRWVLTDAGKAKEVLKERHIRPLLPSAMQAWHE